MAGLTFEQRTKLTEDKAAKMRARVNLKAALELLVPAAKSVARSPEDGNARADYDRASIAFMGALNAVQSADSAKGETCDKP